MEDEDRRAVEEAVDAELRLLDPEVRASPDRVSALLAPQCVESGASGRRWDAASIPAATGSDPVAPDRPTVVSGVSGVLLAPGVVHLTYLCDHRGRRTRRSSLWRRTSAGRRLYFHRGTPTTDA